MMSITDLSDTRPKKLPRMRDLGPAPTLPLAIDYTPELGEEVCKYVAEGYTLRQIYRMEGFPSPAQILTWVRRYKEFEVAYRQAQDIKLDVIADQILEIADNSTNDWMEHESKFGHVKVKADVEHIVRSRLRVETRKWLLMTLKPDTYGDRLKVAHSGVTAQLVISDSPIKVINDLEDRIRSESRADDRRLPEERRLSAGDNGPIGVG